MRVALLAHLVLLGSVAASASPVRIRHSEPHDGIVHEHWSDDALPAELELVRIDLTSSEIAMHATREADKGKTTSAYAASLGAQVAINGDAFTALGYTPRGLAMGESAMWSQTADDAAMAVLHLRRQGERTVATIVPPETVVTLGALPAGTEGVVSGRPLLVREGSLEPIACDDPGTFACARGPRSAIGVSADGNTLLIATVDGWQTSSTGMTAAELATFLRARGAYTAMMLDSGSSSTLVLDGAVVNHPSDGAERTVANHLAFKYGALPKGQLYGLICKEDLIACRTPNSPLRMAGATVTLDDGRVLTTVSSADPNVDGAYDFTGVTPRLACVTVKKPGFLTRVKCGPVPAGDIGYNSVPIFPGMDMVDAGVADASETVADAADSTPGSDGGPGLTSPGNGGCCDAGGDRSPLGASLMTLICWQAWFRSRRRGTNLN